MTGFRSEDKPPKEKVSSTALVSEWNDLRSNKVIVSMSSTMFQQEVVLRYGNDVFTSNFTQGSDNAMQAGIWDNLWGQPFRDILFQNTKKNTRFSWPEGENLVNPYVESSIQHSMLSGEHVSLFAILIGPHGFPLTTHLYCTPLMFRELPDFSNVPQDEMDNGSFDFIDSSCIHGSAKANTTNCEEYKSRADVSGTYWAQITLHSSSQIGCAMQYGYGFGHGNLCEWSPAPGTSAIFKRGYEKTETKYEISEANKVARKEAVLAGADTSLLTSSPRESKNTNVKEMRGNGGTHLPTHASSLSLENPCPPELKLFGLSEAVALSKNELGWGSQEMVMSE